MSGLTGMKSAKQESTKRGKVRPQESLCHFSLSTPQVDLLTLQRQAGNSTASALIQRNLKGNIAAVQRRTTISQPDDPLEREAERIAKMVMRAQATGADHSQSKQETRRASRGGPGSIQMSSPTLRYRLLRAPSSVSVFRQGLTNQESQTPQPASEAHIIHTKSGDFPEEDIRLFAAVIFAESNRKHPREGNAIGYVFKRKLSSGMSIRTVAYAKTKGRPVYGTVTGQKGQGSREFRAFMGAYEPKEWTGFPKEKTVSTKTVQLPQTMEEYAKQIAEYREPFYQLALDILNEVAEDPCPGAIGQGGMVDLFSNYPSKDKNGQYAGEPRDSWWKSIREEGRYVQIGDTVCVWSNLEDMPYAARSKLTTPTSQIQRVLARQITPDSPEPPIEVLGELEASLFAQQGSGNRLSESTQLLFESLLGSDLSDIRVHADRPAAKLAESLDARAFAYGNDIFFAQGEYCPTTAAGKHLLAHELVHVMQQLAASEPISIQCATSDVCASELSEGESGVISSELEDAPQLRDPRLRVMCWLQQHSQEISDAESRFHVDRRAIAGAIAWEALENVRLASYVYLSRAAPGPGKVHIRQRKYVPSWVYEGNVVAGAVEERGYLPPMSRSERIEAVSSPSGAIERIGAILAAYADISERHGYCVRQNVPVLLNLYQGFRETLDGYEKYLAKEKNPMERLGYGNDMAIWAAGNLDYLKKCVGAPGMLACESTRAQKMEMRRTIYELGEERTASLLGAQSARQLPDIDADLQEADAKLKEFEGLEQESASREQIAVVEAILQDLDYRIHQCRESCSVSDPEYVYLIENYQLAQSRLDKLRGDLVRERFSRRILMTPREIAEIRQGIDRIEVETKLKADLYEELQTKVQYLNERYNTMGEDPLEGGTCNLTSLAMCLMYLGISNPDPALTYSDALEAIRVKKDPSKSRTSVEGWGMVARELGVEVSEIVPYTKPEKTFTRSWYEQNVRDAHLRQGHAVMLDTPGHIVRVQAVTNEGLVVDDPFGYLRLPRPSGASGQFAAMNPREPWESSGSRYPGEDSLWPWNRVEGLKILWIYFLRK